MAGLNIALPSQESQTEINLRRWEELLKDSSLNRIEGRIETDRHGHIITSPPPAASHGAMQSEIAYLLRTLMRGGRVVTECPISTADGVRAGRCGMGFAATRSRVGKSRMLSEGAGDLCRSFVARQHGCRDQRESSAVLRRGCLRSLDLRYGRQHAVPCVTGWTSGNGLPLVPAISAARGLALISSCSLSSEAPRRIPLPRRRCTQLSCRAVCRCCQK